MYKWVIVKKDSVGLSGNAIVIWGVDHVIGSFGVEPMFTNARRFYYALKLICKVDAELYLNDCIFDTKEQAEKAIKRLGLDQYTDDDVRPAMFWIDDVIEIIKIWTNDNDKELFYV